MRAGSLKRRGAKEHTGDSTAHDVHRDAGAVAPVLRTAVRIEWIVLGSTRAECNPARLTVRQPLRRVRGARVGDGRIQRSGIQVEYRDPLGVPAGIDPVFRMDAGPAAV